MRALRVGRQNVDRALELALFGAVNLASQSEATSYNAYSGPFQVDEDKQTEPPRGRARVALEDAAAVSRPQQTGHRQLHGSFGGSLPNYCTTEMGPK